MSELRSYTDGTFTVALFYTPPLQVDQMLSCNLELAVTRAPPLTRFYSPHTCTPIRTFALPKNLHSHSHFYTRHRPAPPSALLHSRPALPPRNSALPGPLHSLSPYHSHSASGSCSCTRRTCALALSCTATLEVALKHVLLHARTIRCPLWKPKEPSGKGKGSRKGCRWSEEGWTSPRYRRGHAGVSALVHSLHDASAMRMRRRKSTTAPTCANSARVVVHPPCMRGFAGMQGGPTIDRHIKGNLMFESNRGQQF